VCDTKVNHAKRRKDGQTERQKGKNLCEVNGHVLVRYKVFFFKCVPIILAKAFCEKSWAAERDF
jgi:hypothetical protein